MVISDSMKAFILHWGEMGPRWGVNRTVAQVHALLYLSTEALTAEEIASTLSVARSNVSNSLRELENWNLVRSAPRMGDRREHFETSHDVWELFLTVIEQRVEREILPTLAMLKQCAADAAKERPARPEVSARIATMQVFLADIYGWYVQMKALPQSTLRGVIRVGSGITRLLPSGRTKARTQ
jgi:DNA-binding transcriptional regulator GbsR (MarR family)